MAANRKNSSPASETRDGSNLDTIGGWPIRSTGPTLPRQKIKYSGGVFSIAGTTLELSRIESACLMILRDHIDHIVTHEELRLYIWPRLSISNETLNRVVFTIRRKLLVHKYIIVTHHSQGYRLKSERLYGGTNFENNTTKYASHLIGASQLGQLGPDHSDIISFTKQIMGFHTESNLVAAAGALDDWHTKYRPNPDTLVARAEIALTNSMLGYSDFRSAFGVGSSVAFEAVRILAKDAWSGSEALSNYASAINAWFSHLDGSGQDSTLAKLREASKRFPKDQRVSFLLGWALVHSGEILDALDVLQSAIQLLEIENIGSLTDNGCECLRGAVLLALGDVKQHHSNFVQLEQKYKYSSWAQQISASYLMSIGEFNAADNIIRKWRGIDFFSRKWACAEATFRYLTNEEGAAKNIIDNDLIVHKYKPNITEQIYPTLLVYGDERAIGTVISTIVMRCPSRMFSKINPEFDRLYSALSSTKQISSA